MFKALSLMLILAVTAGCQSQPRPGSIYTDPSFVGLRCTLIAGKKPFAQENLDYIELHADDGNAQCKVMLGRMYEEGGHGVDQDFSKARALFVEAAKLDPGNNIMLGQMAERGEGEPVDYVKARELYRLSGKNAVLQLGRLMEDGKGGARDVPGAFAFYLESVESYDDDAWLAMIRLRKQGQPLNKVQAQRYQEIWLKGFLNQQLERLRIKEVFEAANAAGEAKKVTLLYRFKRDSGIPQVTTIKSSGDTHVDKWVMEGASRINMGDSAPPIDESGELELQAPLVFSPQDTSRLDWLCGNKPCR